MHLATYNSDPNRDCSSLLVHECLLDHFLHVSLSNCNFSTGIETERSTVSTRIPKHVTSVLGGTSFLVLTARPNSASNCYNLMYALSIWDCRETHKKSSILFQIPWPSYFIMKRTASDIL